MKFKSNSSQFAKRLREVVAEKKIYLARKIVATSRFVHQSLIDKTPVWEGKTVRNYIMTINTPFSGEYEEIGTGDTGRTSLMPLGPEPRRAANAEAALASGKVLTEKSAFSRIFITNNTDTVSGLETGSLPGAGKRSRSPEGMFAVTLEEASSRLRSKRL